VHRVIQWAAEARANSVFLREILEGGAGAFIDSTGEVRIKTIDPGDLPPLP
jgi:hypothetical protein